MHPAHLPSLSVLTRLTSPKYRVTWKTFLFPIIGLAAFFIYIYIFNVDIQAIFAKIQQIDIRFYLMAAVAVFLDTLFFTATWDLLLRFLKVKVSLFRLFMFVWVGVFVDTLIPAESVSGEVSKIYLVNREQPGSTGKATASVVAQRLMGMSINVATLVAGAVLLLTEKLLYGTILTLVLLLVTLSLLFFVLLLLLCVKENWTLRIVDGLIRFAERISKGRWKLLKLREEAIGAAKSFHEAMKQYAHAPKTLSIAFFFSAISWIISLIVFYLTFRSIGYPQITWSAILIISTIFIAAKSVPIGVPFEVGLPEITLTFLLSLFGVPLDISATATILMRLLTLWLRFFIGFAAQQWIGIKTMTTHANGEVATGST